MAAADEYQGSSPGLDGPAIAAAAVTPADDADLDYTTRGLYVGTTGDVTVRMKGSDTAVTFASVPAGAILPLRVDRVMDTDTTASYIVAIW